jgi:hypothetical protein
MEKYFFMKPVLVLISQGQFFRKAFAVALQILSAVIAIAGLVSWVGVWKSISGYSAEAIFGIIIFQLFFVIAIYMVVHTLLIRAGDINVLPDADYIVIPIVSICLKLAGEIYACFITMISIGGAILLWFLGGNAIYLIKRSAPLVPGFGGGDGFWGGLVFMFCGLFTALFVLVIFYFLGETVIVMSDAARNLKITRKIAEQYDRK